MMDYDDRQLIAKYARGQIAAEEELAVVRGRAEKIEAALRDLLAWFDLDARPGHAVIRVSKTVPGQWALPPHAYEALLAAYAALGETPH